MPSPTLKDIAEALGYSKNTISLGLRGSPQIPLATQRKVKEAADRMGYRPNPVITQLMSQLRAARTTQHQATLALVNANLDRNAFSDHPTIPIYVEGCTTRAASLGYDLDRFWLHDPDLTAERWLRILSTRGIKGIVLVGLMDTNRLPARFTAVWERFPTVVTGVRTRDPALSFCCVDHHNLALNAFEHALTLGYQRPGLVLDRVIDALVEHRFSAGYAIGQHRLPRSRQVPVFGDADGKGFGRWLDRYQPDVLLTLYNSVRGWLKAEGRRIPDDIGLIQLEWRASRPEIAGMNQHNRVTGEAAVEMVVSQIHRNETGVQEFPRATLIGATWVDGPSVRRRAGLPEPGGGAPGRRRARPAKARKSAATLR